MLYTFCISLPILTSFNKHWHPAIPYKPQSKMKKSIQDLKESLRKKEQKQQRLHEQEDKIEKDIRVLRYLIEREEQAASAQAPRKRKIARKQVSDFFTRIALFYEDLQRRLDLRITYRCFCRWLCTRYEFESRYRDRHKLSPCTVLGYFKRERGG